MATIKDVAKLAGVSVGSVSKYLNGFQLKDKTRLAIEEAIKALNYEPNVYAKGLKTNRTNSVVLIIPSVWHPFFSELAYYIEKYLNDHQIKLILCNTSNSRQKEIEYFTMARQYKVDGIIAITYSNIDGHLIADFPVVSIDRQVSQTAPFITSDNYGGGYLAAEQLVKAGCQSLAYIGYGSSFENATSYRRTGFEAFCHKKEIPFYDYYTNQGRGIFETRIEKLVQDIQCSQLVDGVFVDSDDHALVVIRKLLERGIKVPEDIQIIGFDGSLSHKDGIRYLSTIRQDVEMIAKEAVTILVNRIAGVDIKETINKIIPISFWKGETTR